MWNIDEIEDDESVLAAAPIIAEGPDFTRRLVLTNHRIITIRSPYFASALGFARFAHSQIESSIPLGEVQSVAFEGRFVGSLELRTRGGMRSYGSTGLGSRWLRHLADRIAIQIGPQDGQARAV